MRKTRCEHRHFYSAPFTLREMGEIPETGPPKLR